MLFFSLGVYFLALVFTIFALQHPQFLPLLAVYATYAGIFIAINFILHGFLIGHVKANSVKLSPNQFPEVYDTLAEICGKMNVSPIPDVYVMQAGGVLNAFATCFIGKNFVVIYADIFEMAYHHGQEALQFVLCHELGHIRRGHTTIWKRIGLLPGKLVPFLGSAYSRACEYTCDRYGAHLYQAGSNQGLLALASGKVLYQKVDTQSLITDTSRDQGFWTWFSEIFASHPHLINRLKHCQNLLNKMP
jgi:Zn-dependent protease with chaperone function